MKLAGFDDLNEFNLLSRLELLSSTRTDRFDSRLSPKRADYY